MTPSSPSTSTPGSAEPAWGRYERLRPDQIEAIRAAHPVAYVPWGALEWHSYHAPVGLDGLQALGQAEALARALGGLVLPPVYVGTDTIKPFKGFGHTVEHAASTVTTLAREFLDQLTDEGFRVIVLLTGHAGGGHVEALQAAVDAFEATEPGVGVHLTTSFDPVADTYSANHAAHGETSLQLLFAADLVDLSRQGDGPAPTLDDDGVWGDDPRTASAEDGRAILNLFVERMTARLTPLFDRYLP